MKSGLARRSVLILSVFLMLLFVFFLDVKDVRAQSGENEEQGGEGGTSGGEEEWDPFASENPTEEEIGTTQEVVVTARRENESVQDPAAFVEEIDLSRYQGRFATTADVLAGATGVRVRDFGGLGREQTVSIRGSDPQQVVVLVDGVRLNSAAGGGVDLSTIPLDQVERIEVMRGGSGALQGSGAIGGVINIVTKKAGRKPSTTLYSSYGSFNTFEARAAHSRPLGGKAGFLVSGDYLHSDGNFEYIDNRGTEFNKDDDKTAMRRNNGLDTRSALVKGDYDFGPVALSAQNQITVSDRGQPGIVTFPSPHAHQHDEQNLANVSASAAPASWLGTGVRFDYRYQTTTFEDPYGEQTGVPVKTSTAEHDPAGELKFDFAWPEWNLFTIGGGAGEQILKDSGGTLRRRSAADAFARDQLSLWAKRIIIVPAVRFDQTEDVGGQWSPKAGLIFEPWEFLAVKGNAGRSFRAPNFTELYANQGLTVGNPDLKPERAFSADAGFQIRTQPVYLEAVYFHQMVTDLIEYVLVSGFRYKPFNFASVRVDGAEFSGNVRPHEWVQASANYTITYAIDESGEPNRNGIQIPGRPRYLGNATLEVGPKWLKATGEYNYVGENYITFGGAKMLPARELWNVGLTGRPIDGLVLGAQVKNLTDQRVSDVRGFPLPGRSWFGTVEYAF